MSIKPENQEHDEETANTEVENTEVENTETANTEVEEVEHLSEQVDEVVSGANNIDIATNADLSDAFETIILDDEPTPPAVPDAVIERMKQQEVSSDTDGAYDTHGTHDTYDGQISLDEVEREQRGRISLTEYSNRQRHNKRVRVALTFLATILVLMLIALIVVGVLMFLEADKKNVSTSAQQDSTTLLEDADEKEKVTATSEVVNLVSLLGLTKDEAILHIGHGATVESETPIEVGNLKSEVVVPLTEEQGDPKRGTPTVVLRLNEGSQVGWASYTAPTSALGYGTISFVDAIQSAHVIQNSLRAAGLTDLNPAVLNAPTDSASYSTYDTDGKTLITEQTSFNGTGKQGDGVYDWGATLTYDYSNANQSGNLADTIRRISISVEPSSQG